MEMRTNICSVPKPSYIPVFRFPSFSIFRFGQPDHRSKRNLLDFYIATQLALSAEYLVRSLTSTIPRLEKENNEI